MGATDAGRYVPEHIQDNHRQRVADGHTTWDDLGREAAAGGDRATARWAREQAAAADQADAATDDSGPETPATPVRAPKGRQQQPKDTA